MENYYCILSGISPTAIHRLGLAINFDGSIRDRARVLLANAGYWIDEFHFDGLRWIATQDIY